MSVKTAHLPLPSYERDHDALVELLGDHYDEGYYCPGYELVAIRDGYGCANCDWECDFFEDAPIGGDELLTYQGKRILKMSVDLWHLPKVKPRHATAGIINGSRIKLYGPHGPVLTVNRVGTIAGGGTIDYGDGTLVNQDFTASAVYQILMDGEN